MYSIYKTYKVTFIDHYYSFIANFWPCSAILHDIGKVICYKLIYISLIVSYHATACLPWLTGA